MKKILYIILAALLNLSAYAQTDPDVIEFAFISDTHRYGPTADVRYSEENIAAFVKYCKETPSIKFAIHGGDFMNAYDTNHKQAIFCLERGRQDFAGIGIPFYATKGNHDCNGKQRTPDGRRDGTQIVTDHEYFQLFSPLSPTNPLADSTDIVYDHNNREVECRVYDKLGNLKSKRVNSYDKKGSLCGFQKYENGVLVFCYLDEIEYYD